MLTMAQRQATMATSTGFIHPLMLRPGEVDERDIAQALSRMPHFHGRGEEFMSVGQHCVEVARLLRGKGADTLTQITGLLHDAEEAYPPGDIVSPVKAFMPSARRMLARSRRSVFVYFLGFEPSPEVWREVEKADQEVLMVEAIRLFPNWRKWPNLQGKPKPPDVDKWRGPVPMKQAEMEFLDLLLGLIAEWEGEQDARSRG